ncbi:MAG: sulfite exporter TauE/SafE family protein [Rhodospirillaceae bacterium]|jgi:hypothetical protein|nr:sulfite exporter TauE/SafE family protein [Rhodospirillaceae bacterium]MBT5809206.1 sulfite exporter TauE/SafE family protein [Rhodospirillaceae bacterium]
MLDNLEALIGTWTYLQLAMVAGTVVLAGYLRGFVGFGAALIIVMVLNQVLDPLAAVPIATLSGVPVMIQLLPNAFRHAERSFVTPFGLAAFAAAPLGALVLVSVDAEIMKMAISLFVLAMVVMLHKGWRLGGRPGSGVLIGAGAIAGFVQGAASVGGPPAVVVALSRPGAPQQQRANVIGAVTTLSLCSLAPLWYYGLFTRDVIFISIAIIPFYTGSTWVGARFFSHQGHRHFRNAALLALAAIGFVTLGLAVRDFLTG